MRTGRYSLLTALFALGLAASGFAQAAKVDPVRAAIEDAIAFPPDADLVRGRAAIQALWQSLRDAGAKSLSVLEDLPRHLERHAGAREMRARSGCLTSGARGMNV